MRWQFVVLMLGFFSLVAYVAKLRYQIKKQEKLNEKNKSNS